MYSELPNTETDWWLRLLDGDQEALGYFYQKYADTLLKYGLSIVYNRDLVRDAVQELFVQIWNRRKNLTTPNSVKYYLIASLRRIILKSVIDDRKQLDTNSDDDYFVNNYSQITELDVPDIDNILQGAIRTLPPRQQELVFLRFFENMSYEAISEVTGLDYQILRNTLYRAIKSLRHNLSDKIDLLLPLMLLLFACLLRN
ncbi:MULTISPECIES: sigma-70 family RNA polymerase sigma factor [unclassified Arcicella]|uniref:RNA polymerase sigma factor n=1 Tax=unclassified Arcicella TaxID=2644986 RepID=UPI0028674956|nr:MULTISPECIES: sigma-70 family RNA polymerase sigma factor [unclassified Arcicella]MDR6562228.1 RNA polymerase sigma factor (sigma-70 family) [Arcicella sp. BE51]MDR6812078.1 RNA polymerase sigma factor (sigma-70 family) [Arcicella sp. BE140]MDR6823389.1 RNA polymerase sigma factor (sigma-70 family) [Arcicella sp. BE139]